MDSSFYLFEKNHNSIIKYPQVFGNKCLIKVENGMISMSELSAMLGQLAFVIRIKKITDVLIATDEIRFADKLVYILFECTIYSLITKYKKSVYLQCKSDPLLNILTAGIEESLIYRMVYNKIKNDDFKEEFKKSIIGKNHFRKIISKEMPSDYFSKLMGDIKTFLRNSFIYNKRDNVEADKLYIDNVANVIIELVQNANEHSNSDCLVDIDLSGDWYRPKNEAQTFLTVNLIVLNFSDVLLGDTVKEKILNSHNREQVKYYDANEIYNHQKRYYGKIFDEDTYFNIMAFQNGISGRKNTVTGGTGLPLLLNFLVGQSETEYCYMLSGRDGLKLGISDLKVSEEWIAFNKNNNIFQPPDKEFLIKNNLYLPGCAFNLNLTLKQEVIET